MEVWMYLLDPIMITAIAVAAVSAIVLFVVAFRIGRSKKKRDIE